MLETLVNVRIVSAGHRISVHKEFIKNKKYHSLFYKDQGRTYYKHDVQEFYLNTDSVVYLPKGSDYYYENCGETEGKIFYVTFDCDPEIPIAPQCFDLKNSGEVRKLFVKVFRAFRFGGTSGKLDAYCNFYRLLSALEQNMEYSKTKLPDTRRIKPAVEYLLEHLFDADLRISNLHEHCGISAPTFRRLFEKAFECTPKKYVLQQRIQSAADLLKSGEYSSISAVAEAVGFEDQLYFSKCFKQFYGVAPSVYKTK